MLLYGPTFLLMYSAMMSFTCKQIITFCEKQLSTNIINCSVQICLALQS